MRTAILENCLPENAPQLLDFKQYTVHNQLEANVQMVGNQEILSLFNDDQMTDVLRQTFDKANCFVRKGILSCFFYFIGLYTLISAVFPFMINRGE
jgi:hypothetical protein